MGDFNWTSLKLVHVYVYKSSLGEGWLINWLIDWLIVVSALFQPFIFEWRRCKWSRSKYHHECCDNHASICFSGGHYNHQTPLKATDIVIYSGDLDSCGTKRQNEAFFRVRLRFIITAAVPRKKSLSVQWPIMQPFIGNGDVSIWMQYFRMGSIQYYHLVVWLIKDHVPSTKGDIVYHKKKCSKHTLHKHVAVST